MSDRRSNASATNSDASTLDSAKSKILPPSDIAGTAKERRPNRIANWNDPPRRGFGNRSFLGSLKFKLLALIGIFITLPFVLYWQFEQADHKMRDLVTHGIQQQNRLIAQAMTPSLEALGTVPDASLNQLLAKYTTDGTLLSLVLRPRFAGHFFYVAAMPIESQEELAGNLDELENHGISPQLDRTCAANAPDDVRYARNRSRDELLTSVIPIQTALGCWVLIASHSTDEFLDTSIGRSYAQIPAVHFAVAIYLALAALSSLIAFNVWRNIQTFRTTAREIREGRGHDRPFASRSIAPEFAGVAADFDGFVVDLRNAARDIREAAEDNAHSFKAPVATIEAAAESLKRQLPADEPRQARTMALITASVGRLKALIFAAERFDRVTADLIDAPRTSIDLAEIVDDVLLRYHDVMARRHMRAIRYLDGPAFVRAGKGMLEVAVENIIDNAISFSPAHGTVEVRLTRDSNAIELRIDDQGPGIDPSKIERIFERYFSLRVHEPTDDDPEGAVSHSGLGLWVVRRNIEALGGTVSAINRATGGLSLRLTLPSDRS
jgi:two-component system sensor histidine kinase ChvG